METDISYLLSQMNLDFRFESGVEFLFFVDGLLRDCWCGVEGHQDDGHVVPTSFVQACIDDLGKRILITRLHGVK